MANLNVVVTDLVVLLAFILILILKYRTEVQDLQTQTQERQTQTHEHLIQIQELQKRTRQQTMHIAKVEECQDDLSQKIINLDTKFQTQSDLNQKLTNLEMKFETELEKQKDQLDYQNQKINDGEEMSYRLRRQELDTIEYSIIQQCKSMIEALEVEFKTDSHERHLCREVEEDMTNYYSEWFSNMEQSLLRRLAVFDARLYFTRELLYNLRSELRCDRASSTNEADIRSEAFLQGG